MTGSSFSPTVHSETVSFVLRGTFEPSILQPLWLAKHDLILDTEAEVAEIEFISKQLTSYNAEWLKLQVTRDRFLVATDQAAYHFALRDLVLGCLRLLPQTPLSKLGMNRTTRFDFGTAEYWHGFGDKLAPKEEWRELLNSPGLRNLAVEGTRPDGKNGYILAKIEPILGVKEKFLASIEVNDHYVLDAADESPESASEAVELISEDWDGSMERAEEITNHLIKNIKPRPRES